MALRKLIFRYIAMIIVVVFIALMAHNIDIIQAYPDSDSNECIASADAALRSNDLLAENADLETNNHDTSDDNTTALDPNNELELCALQNIVLNNGELAIGEFASDVYNYATCSDNLSYVLLKLETCSANSLIKINGIDVNNNESAEIERAVLLSGGFNDIVVSVSEENKPSQDYIISVLNNDGQSHYRSLSVDLNNSEIIVSNNTPVENLKTAIQTINCDAMIISAGKPKANNKLCSSGDILLIKNDADETIYSAHIVVNGDINRDGSVTEKDIDIVKSHILETHTISLAEMTMADVDKDGEITVRDLGILRTFIDSDVELSPNDIVMDIELPEYLYTNTSASISINATRGSYFAEGYLIYNEGKLTTKNVDNSGRIHFIADGNKILFDNGYDYIAFAPIVESGSIDFEIEIVQAYDYVSKSNFEIAVNNQSSTIKNSDIDVIIQQNDQETVTLVLTNISSMSIGNINVELGKCFTNSNGKNTVNLTGLRPGHKHNVKLYAADGLSNGSHEATIKVNYQDAQCVTSTIVVPLSFEIENCNHENVWQYNELGHYINCDQCANGAIENHDYIKEGLGQYKCSVCGYEKSISLNIEVDGNFMLGNEVVFKPAIQINGQAVGSSTIEATWYVNGNKVSDDYSFITRFDSIGYHTIDCVITNEEGLITVKSINFYVNQNDVVDSSTISIANLTCKMLVMQKYVGYEYKLNDGQWQNFGVFLNLEEGGEYVVYQRQKGDASTETSLKITVGHKITEWALHDSTCGKNITKNGTCSFCRKSIIKEIAETTCSHLFADYQKSMEATCISGSIIVADCIYNCGIKDEKVLNDKQYHMYTNYVFDNNTTCTYSGTCTALCDYGCGSYDTIPIDSEPSGHQYVYVSNNDATEITSMTETGICQKCGEINTRTIDGTRLKHITEIHVDIPIATVQCYGLPQITTKTEGIIISDATWQDSQGFQFNDKTQDVVVKNNETYKLISLTISADEKHVLSEDVTMFVNGHQISEIISSDRKTITIVDVGQFNFSQSN